MSKELLVISGLRVRLPDGRRLFDGLDLELCEGEVVALLGGSGAGKSTLARVLFERDDLLDTGFSVEPADAVRLAEGASLGLVPQRGAAFDHLDVAGNIALALRHRVDEAQSQPQSVESWLAAVDLPSEMSSAGTKVGRLSGGQAQRLAVARTLASGRRVLFLDEPSVGLDPLRVRGLAELVRETARERGAAVLVVTHDLSFAEQVADRLLFLDPARGKLVALGGDEQPGDSLQSELLDKLEAADAPREDADDNDTARRPTGRLAALGRSALGSLLLPAAALVALPRALRHAGDALRVASRVLRSALLRPLPFYLIVSVLLGYTVLYVISRALPVGLRAGKAVELVGGSYILALAPPVCAFLFVATSGSAISAWLGSMGLTRQISALEALGISRRDYLWVPCYFGLTIAFVLVAATFAAGMALGGYWHCVQAGVADPWPLLLGDLLDPEPHRAVLRTRALWLVGIYAFGVAAEVVYRGTLRKESADDVTRAMTGSVVIATLWVVLLELVTAMWVFRR